MNLFGNVMHFFLVKTEMEYLKHIQSYNIQFNFLVQIFIYPGEILAFASLQILSRADFTGS